VSHRVKWITEQWRGSMRKDADVVGLMKNEVTMTIEPTDRVCILRSLETHSRVD